ncbi:hypothetical protein K9L67_01020 [Candidatus Woesearchaeota archaeon]|nr:hypothetical protein [Candidatus Woesearchaeota archaeon]MCF7900785.1 hypothetical protein [Candidatus Woesearchaeota archaeon]MCF8013087.1 hypothetical protein [Candidatus Woesearchaeota archaeon]
MNKFTALSFSLFLFLNYQNNAQEKINKIIPLPNKTLVENVIKAKYDNEAKNLLDIFEDPSFHTDMHVKSSLSESLLENLLLKEPYGSVEYIGKIASLTVGGSYKTKKLPNGKIKLSIEKEELSLPIIFEKLYSNQNNEYNIKTIVYCGETNFGGVAFEGLISVQYFEKDSLNIRIDAYLTPSDAFGSVLFFLGDLIGEVPSENEIKKLNISLQRDFQMATDKLKSYEFEKTLISSKELNEDEKNHLKYLINEEKKQKHTTN